MSFQVTNTGRVDGAVVGQVYVADPVGGMAVNVVRPWKRLAGFTKIFVRAGETGNFFSFSDNDFCWTMLKIFVHMSWMFNGFF